MVGWDNTQSTSDTSKWYLASDSYGYWFKSTSWSVVTDQIRFQIGHYPGGSYGSSYPGVESNYTYNDANKGDLLAYDFKSDGIYDHMSLEVGVGSTSDGMYGDMVDAHTSNRYHRFWTLQNDNPDKNTTTIRVIHISSSNN